jgi:excisionase family DNA binding protein
MSLSRTSGVEDLFDTLAAAVRDAMRPSVSGRPHDVPRVALTPAEAADSLGCSAEFFREHVDSELRWIRRGRKRFVPFASLEEWVSTNAERTL